MLVGFDPQDSATRIGRYLTSGSPDGAFGTDGVVVSGQEYTSLGNERTCMQESADA